MKLDNKGFVVSTLMYSLLIVFLFLIIGLITLLSNRKMILDKLKKDVKEDLNGMVKYDVYANGTAIYYNPVTGKICSNYTEDNSLNENKTGCLKWYVFNDSINRSKVNMILDHNTKYRVAYNSTGTNAEPKEISDELNKLMHDYNWQVTPRLITADEIAKITGNDSFDSSDLNNWFYFDSNDKTNYSTSTNKSKYSWLFDYTNSCTTRGCNINDSNTYGYWTNTPVKNDNSRVWLVFDHSGISDTQSTDSTRIGIRPVISIDKKDLKKSFTTTYNYKNDVQTYVTPVPGNYKIELWGAQGGKSKDDTENSRGGYGAYSVGTVQLTDTKLYIYVGGAGTTCTTYGSTTSGTRTCGDDGGYNGGGATRQYINTTLYGSGGGATHVALQPGLLSDLTSANISKVVAVAGGGGGSSYWSGYQAKGGNAGGIVGSMSEVIKTDRQKSCTGGSQTAAGTGNDTTGQGFGRGGSISSYVGPGGGSGLYGGGTSEVVSCGGSSYIGYATMRDRHMTCYDCTTDGGESTKTISNDCHDTDARADCSKEGNGYAKITYLGK